MSDRDVDPPYLIHFVRRLLYLVARVDFVEELSFLAWHDDVLVTDLALFRRSVHATAGVDDVRDQLPVGLMSGRLRLLGSSDVGAHRRLLLVHLIRLQL